MRIVVLHNAVPGGSGPHEVLAQVEVVEAALQTLGHSTRRLPCTLNFEAVEEALSSDRPQLVFNLVASLAGSDRLGHLAAVLLDDLDLRYTGAPARTLHLTWNKPRSKQRIRAAGLPTPDWLLPSSPPSWALTPPYIIKAVWEHASLGLDAHAVITEGDGSTVRAQIESRSRQLGQACFAERYIPGREFHLALIAAGEQPRVLPPAEIDFSGLPPGKPQIVADRTLEDGPDGAPAAWPRRFEFPARDAPLLDWLKALALACWQALDLAGYAQIDFRVDPQGQPWILEVNANPSLAPQGLVAAALARAGLPLPQAIQWIVEDALRPHPAPWEQEAAPLAVPPRAAATPAPPAPGPATPVLPPASGPGGGAPAAAEAPLPAAAGKEADAPPGARSKPRAGSSRRPRGVKLRSDLKPENVELVRQIVAALGTFRVGQAERASALVARRLAEGPCCGFDVLLAERKEDVVGFLLYGKDPLSVSSFDILWIAVEPSQHGQGIGRMLLEEAERRIVAAGGTQVVLQTLEHPEEPALHAFYEHCGYTRMAVLEDYYGPGENQVLYRKVLAA